MQLQSEQIVCPSHVLGSVDNKLAKCSLQIFEKLFLKNILFFPLHTTMFMQWLKQIEGTEAALTQKMLDLENEKVRRYHSFS